MKKLLALAIVWLVPGGCGQGNKTSRQQDSIVIHSDTATNNNTDTAANTDLSVAEGNSVIRIRFAPGSTSASVVGHVNNISSRVNVYVAVAHGSELTANIAPEDSIANIRFNQIIYPSGKADGPFGRDLKKPVTEKGNYQLVIAEDQMQAQEWNGDFVLTVTVK